jgi:hypothetical protein
VPRSALFGNFFACVKAASLHSDFDISGITGRSLMLLMYALLLAALTGQLLLLLVSLLFSGILWLGK